MIGIVKKAARQITQADGAAFVLRDGDRCHCVDADTVGPLWKGRKFSMDVCISGWAMRNRQPTIVPDIFVDARIPHEAYRPTFVKSLAMVPIRSLDPIGAIGIYWREPNCPTSDSVRWLQSLADSTSPAIEHLQARIEINNIRYRADLMHGEISALRNDAETLKPMDCVRMRFVTNRIEVNGQWLSIEAFLSKRFGLNVTDGLSPESVERVTTEILAKQAPKRIQAGHWQRRSRFRNKGGL